MTINGYLLMKALSYPSTMPFWEMGIVLSLTKNNILFPRNVGPIVSKVFLSLTIKDFTGCIHTVDLKFYNQILKVQ